MYWSPSSKTALAESELEYDPQHKSSSLYLKLALQKPLPPFFNVDNDVPVYIVVWTTTPWTLPANQAVCFDGNKCYSLTQTSHNGTQQYWIVASELLENLRQKWSTPLETVSEFQGSAILFSAKNDSSTYRLKRECFKGYPVHPSGTQDGTAAPIGRQSRDDDQRHRVRSYGSRSRS